MGVTEMRDPEKTYHLQPIATFEATMPGVDFGAFQDAIHSPRVSELNNATPEFFPALMKEIHATDLETLKAYMRYQVLTTSAWQFAEAVRRGELRFLRTQAEWAAGADSAMEALLERGEWRAGRGAGKVYVEQYFAGDSKAKMVQMVGDIEAAMGRDIDQLEWMSPTTKVRAKEKLHEVANKIGYPDKFRDYSKLEIKPDDALGNQERADAFENDRELNKIGKPVDHRSGA